MCIKCDEVGEIPGVQIVQVIPPKMLDVAVVLREAFLKKDLGLVSRCDSGAGDYWYECPCCGAQNHSVGNDKTIALDTVEHQSGCALFKAHKLLEELDQEHPVLFAE